MSESNPEKELESIVVDGWKVFSSEIDITKFVAMTNWGAERISSCVKNFGYAHPEIFYLVGGFSIRQWKRSDGTFTKSSICDLKYDINASEYEDKKRKFNLVVMDALDGTYGISDEVGKAFRLHDYLVRVCDYDVYAANHGNPAHRACTAYDALVLHKAVCEGYTMAYRHLLNLAGIKSSVAISEEDCHIWNYVCIRGKWYHVDVTFDDPIYIGRSLSRRQISHEHFLMSDKKARHTGHHSWNVHGLPSAYDESYDVVFN